MTFRRRESGLEAEAVVALLAAVEDGLVESVGSDYLDFEIRQDVDPERVRRAGRTLAVRVVTPVEAVELIPPRTQP